MSDAYTSLEIALLSIVALVSIATIFTIFLQAAWKAGIKRGIEIERGDWNNVGKLGRREDG